MPLEDRARFGRPEFPSRKLEKHQTWDFCYREKAKVCAHARARGLQLGACSRARARACAWSMHTTLSEEEAVGRWEDGGLTRTCVRACADVAPCVRLCAREQVEVPVVGRYVRIALKTSEYITIAEVQAFARGPGGSDQLLTATSATMSSTKSNDPQFAASYCIDGQTGGLCCHSGNTGTPYDCDTLHMPPTLLRRCAHSPRIPCRSRGAPSFASPWLF